MFPRLLEKYHSTEITSSLDKQNESQAITLESTDCENNVSVLVTSVEPDKTILIPNERKTVANSLQNDNARNVIHVLEKITTPGTSRVENILTEYYI